MAKCGVTNIGGGGGIGSDELSVTKEYVLSGKTYVGADTDDEIGTGTMENNGATTNQSLNAGGAFTVKKGYHSQAFNVTANSLASQTSGTATAGQILSGQTAWVNGNKLTGTMAVQSILSFSAAVYSSTAVVFTWKNPAGGPFSGVIIVGKTGSYPTSITDGTRYYKGAGNNSAASGTSSATVSNFAGGTTYYFRGFSYATKENTEWIHSTSYTATAATTKGTQTFTISGTFTVPAEVRSVDVFCVGGGASGGVGNGSIGGGGGGSGRTITVKNIAVTPGQQIAVNIGAGGAKRSYSVGVGNSGGTTSFGSYASAAGGSSGYPAGGNGGSGGGGSGYYFADNRNGGNGGSNGSNGGSSDNAGGTGQGTTTRAFAEASGTLYAGAGGGGSGGHNASSSSGGAGGSGGGGNGGNYRVSPTSGVAGTANTGGGGGGAGGYHSSSDDDEYASESGAGGSGICIIRWGY